MVADRFCKPRNHAALPSRLGQVLCGAFGQAAAGIGNDQLHKAEKSNRRRSKDWSHCTRRKNLTAGGPKIGLTARGDRTLPIVGGGLGAQVMG